MQANTGSTSNLSWIDAKDVYPQAIVGRPAPHFEAAIYLNKDFKNIKLSDYLGQYVVLFFYPLDFTFICPTEILAFADKYDEFAQNKCALLGASIDSKFSHFQYCQLPRSKGGLGDIKVPLVADVTKTISTLYGALFTQGPDAGVAMRATFIIDGKGILRHASYSDLPVGRNVDEVLRLVQAFQFSDENGQVCQSKWKPGKKGMVTDHSSEVTKKYWEEEHTK